MAGTATVSAPTTTVVVSGKEAEIILPPPSDKNPIPSLAAALRVDNQEQLLSLLLDLPSSNTSSTATMVANNNNKQQLLVFGTESMRTLIMRQVLTDPHGRTWNPKQKNWDVSTVFPGLPRKLNLAGTAVLNSTESNGNGATAAAAASAMLHQQGAGVPYVTYILRPTDLSHTQQAVETILHWKNSKAHHRLVYLPHTPSMIHKLLAQSGIISGSGSGTNTGATNRTVTIHSLQMDVFPLEADLLSMEFPDAAREISVEGTPSTLVTDAARTILKLQDVCGAIPRFQAYGSAAEEVLKKTLSLAVEEHHFAVNPVSEYSNGGCGGSSSTAFDMVAAMVLIDRKIDMVTPMVTPLTYEGLLDDVVGIDCGFLPVARDIIDPNDDADNEPSSKKKSDQTAEGDVAVLALNESDRIFSEIRNQHVEQFGNFLQTSAQALYDIKTNFSKTGKEKELTELQKFVKQLPSMQQTTHFLTNHVNLAGLVKRDSEDRIFRERWHMERAMLEGDLCLDELDDMVATQYPPLRFLRLLCLQSLCKNGISSSRYDSLKRDIVQTYGYEYLFVLSNLEKAGLLRRKEAFLGMDKQSRFSKLKDSLMLINAEVNTVDPDDISYVSSGYAPLTVRLIQSAVGGWKNSRDDILKDLPGRFLDITQQNPPQDLATTLKQPMHMGSTYGSLSPVSTEEKKKKPVLLVFYIGGVTYSELTTLRFLSKRSSFPYNIICCTSKVINGSTLVKSLS